MPLCSCVGFSPTRPQDWCPLCPLSCSGFPPVPLGAVLVSSSLHGVLFCSLRGTGVSAGSSSSPSMAGAGRRQLSLEPPDVHELLRWFLEDPSSLVSESPKSPRPQASLHLVLGNLLKCYS